MRQSVRDFFLQDDNTRISAAKKNRVDNEQKRFMLHPMKTLYTKYQSESNIPVSSTFFCKNRPTNDVIPRFMDRDVYICKCVTIFLTRLRNFIERRYIHITKHGRSPILTCV